MINGMTDRTWQRASRKGLIEWVSNNYTHAITLQPNYQVEPDKLCEMFGWFCLDVDRLMFGRKNVHKYVTGVRLQAIAFPEMLDGNPHLHGACDFSRKHWQHRLDKTWLDKLPIIWKRVAKNRYAECKISLIRDGGWGKYITKDGVDFILAADFHNPDRLRDRALDKVLSELN